MPVFERHIRRPGRPTFEVACHRYRNRFTKDHVPEWALRPGPDGRYYAPQYESDREWYASTFFPGEEGYVGNGHDCYSRGPTWPLGHWLRNRYIPMPQEA